MTLNFLSSTWTAVAPAVANHLWQSTLFAVAMWVLTLLLRKNQAQARYWLWMAASLKFLLPFSLLIVFGNRLATKVFETQPTIVTGGLNTRLKTVPLSLSIPTGRLAPGQYDCQITVLDPSGHKAAFWRAPVMLVP